MSTTETPDTGSTSDTPGSPKVSPQPKPESGDANLEAQATPPPPDILYHAKCVEASNEPKVFYSEEPFEGLKPHGRDQVKPTILEVVFTVNGKDVPDSRKSEKYNSYKSKDGKTRAKFGVDGDFIPDSVENLTLHIHSEHLLDELRKVVQYYPSQNLNGNTVLVEQPFRMLFHHISELRNAKSAYEADVQSSKKGESDLIEASNRSETQEKAHALGVLLDYLNPVYAKEIEAGAAKQKLALPLTTYSMLWFLFKPGIDVYAKVGGKWRAFVVMSTEEKEPSDDSMIPYFYRRTMPKEVEKWNIKVWSLAFDGKRLFRRERTFSIERFFGEREINTLGIVPCEVYDKLYGSDRRNELEKRGRIFYDMLKSLPTHFNYSGIGVAKLEKTKPWDQPLKRVFDYTGDIVIDPASYKKNGPTPEDTVYYIRRKKKRIPEDDGETDDEDEGERDTGEQPEVFGGGPRWEGYNGIQPTEQTELTKHQYFLLPADIRGFALKIKQWMAFDVTKIQPIKFPPRGEGAIENLILHSTEVDYLKKLSSKTRLATSHVDFIKGKGEGQIFLFHGPPGTGKTYSVEAIAQYTNRPLLSLTVADLGLTEVKLEEEMTKWFEVATHWGAVLLIDEADVFLEKRKSSGVERNSLVSLFLRSMEYYSGLLFLTTNRPGAIDDAFRSRIHSAIHFRNFNHDKTDLLWTTFSDKVKKENPNIKITASAKRFLSTDKTIKKMEWSGREIRNAFTLALTLARHDHEAKKYKDDDDEEIEVLREHFEDVVIRRNEFIKYIDSIKEMKQDERAYEVGDRRDATLDTDSE